MPMKSLGLKTVVTAGTPVQLSATSQVCNAINIQPIKGMGASTPNLGKLYVGLSNMVKATGVGVLYVLEPGQPATTVQPQSGTLAYADDVSNYWIDADNSGDGALVSYE